MNLKKEQKQEDFKLWKSKQKKMLKSLPMRI